MTGDELVARVEANHRAWKDVIAAAGDRVDEPGAAGEWTLRDVLAHINAYHRFLVLELGGEARPFGDLPEHDGNDVLARNAVLHEAERHHSWDDVVAEHETVHAALLGEIRRRTDAELEQPMVEWTPMSVSQWVTDLTEGHLREHEPDLVTWLQGPG